MADWIRLWFRIPSLINSRLNLIELLVFLISIFFFFHTWPWWLWVCCGKITGFTNEAFGKLHLDDHHDHKLFRYRCLEFSYRICHCLCEWNEFADVWHPANGALHFFLDFFFPTAQAATHIELNSGVVSGQQVGGFELLFSSLSLSFLLIHWKWSEMGFSLQLIMWMHTCLFNQQHLRF